jgi:hypothetical protein
VVGAVLVWFAVQLGRFVGQAPDLDGMIGIRGSLCWARIRARCT